ncbi:MAG: hypothetical protein FJW95_04585 [Actinobacteria bacterium]|nr:hypothetical protein [Actinomycetota bacterium]
MTAPDAAARPVGPHRAFVRAWTAGSAIATLVFVWLVTAGSFDLLRRTRLNGDFYDAQARSLLRGELAISPEILNLEAFRSNGTTYTYFPPGPAFPRLPIVALTHRFDGRTAPLLMTIAFVIAMTGAGFLLWRVRALLRPDAEVGRPQQALYAAVAILVGLGTPLLFMGSRSWIYHEAALWALAFALCAYDQILAFLRRPTGWRLARAGIFAGCSVLSRATIGAGPLLALVLVGAVVVVVRVWPRARGLGGVAGLDPAVCHPRRWLPGLVAAVAIPAVVYATFNYLKFRTFFSVPYDRQDIHTQRFRDVLAANDNSLFNLKAIPTHLLALLRPDGLSIGRVFPFVGFPRTPPRIVGSVVFDQRNLTASVTAAMTLIAVGAAIGVVALIRHRETAPLRLLVLASVLVVPVTLSIVYVAQRYVGDVLIPLLLSAAVGLEISLRAAPAWRTGMRRTVAVVVALAAALGVWSGIALALEYQRVLVPFAPPDERAQYVGWQLDAAGLPGARGPAVLSGDALPEVASLGTLLVLGDCTALYQSDGTQWTGVERSRRAGQWSVTLTPAPVGTEVGLLARAADPESTGAWTLALERLGGDRVRFLWRTPDGTKATGRAFSAPAGERRTYSVLADPFVGEINVMRDGQVLLGASGAPDRESGGLRWGRNAADADVDRFDGGLTVSSDRHLEQCRRAQRAGS